MRRKNLGKLLKKNNESFKNRKKCSETERTNSCMQGKQILRMKKSKYFVNNQKFDTLINATREKIVKF